MPATAAAPEAKINGKANDVNRSLSAKSEEAPYASPCEEFFSLYERKYDLPRGLLRAVSTHESGRRINAKGPSVAWPWTINFAGKGYYFRTKQDALDTAKRLAPVKGERSIDLGCMQVNMKYHPDAFDSYAEGLDPESNVRYGAVFLRARYNATSDWLTAVADYHSRDAEEGRPYAERILRLWKRQQPDLSVALIARYEKRNEGLTATLLDAAPEPVAQAGAAAMETLHKFYMD